MNKFYLSFLVLIVCLKLNQSYTQSSFLMQLGKHDSLYSKVLDEQRDFWVQLPMYFNPQQTYPVVYVLDGSMHLPTVAMVDRYYSGGYIPEMIMVGISNRENRTRDLTCSKVEFRRGRAYQEESGGADKFLEFIKDELIPHVEKNYPVTNYRTLIGHSYGGQFVINTLLKDTELFKNYLAIDPSLDWDEQKLLKQAKEILKNKKFKNRSFFMTLGGQLHLQNDDITIDNVMQDTSEYTLFARSSIELSNEINKNNSNGLKSKRKFYKDDIHGTISLPSIIDGLKYFFAWYPIEGTELFNNPDSPLDSLIHLVESRASILKENFGYTVPPFEEGLFSMLGDMNMQMGQLEKSLTFLKMSTEYYPNSAEAFDALVSYYISQKDYHKALESAKRAFELNDSAYFQKRIIDIEAMK